MKSKGAAVKQPQNEQAVDAADKKKVTRISQSNVPAYSLDEAIRVAQTIHDNYAGDPTTPLNVAAAMGLSPASSHFRQLTGAAIAYGLTEGGYNAPQISLTELARAIVAPTEEDQDLLAKRQAFLQPRVISDFLRKYDGHAVPLQPIVGNVLASMGVPKERTQSVLDLILKTARSLGLLSEIKGKTYVNLDAIGRPMAAPVMVQNDEDDSEDETVTRPVLVPLHGGKGVQLSGNEPSTPSQNRRVFVTHGKNKSLLEPIKKLLSFGELEPVISVEKQSVSQPVPEKVMREMRSCGAAIIHVDDEMVLVDQAAEQHVVLNPNVLIEIGAAQALYGRRFILLVKLGVTLPSNLQGLFEVRYEGDTLDGNATIRLLEAINAMKMEKTELT